MQRAIPSPRFERPEFPSLARAARPVLLGISVSINRGAGHAKRAISASLANIGWPYVGGQLGFKLRNPQLKALNFAKRLGGIAQRGEVSHD